MIVRFTAFLVPFNLGNDHTEAIPRRNAEV
jgi:hypothetical protein